MREKRSAVTHSFKTYTAYITVPTLNNHHSLRSPCILGRAAVSVAAKAAEIPCILVCMYGVRSHTRAYIYLFVEEESMTKIKKKADFLIRRNRKLLFQDNAGLI